MTASKWGLEWTGNGALVILAVCAVALTLGNVRRAFLPPAASLTQPVDSIPDWEHFSAAGSRIGPASARVTLVVFSDYQCPVCRRLWGSVSVITRMYPADLAVVWRHFPLRGHPDAVAAARAAVCADEAGRFETMHSLLFRLQDSLAGASWPSLALQSGISDTVEFNACLGRAETQNRVDGDRAAARAIHAAGTPTLLLNGLEYVGAPRDLGRIVSNLLRRAAGLD